jgi:hypothetical protein
LNFNREDMPRWQGRERAVRSEQDAAQLCGYVRSIAIGLSRNFAAAQQRHRFKSEADTFDASQDKAYESE